MDRRKFLKSLFAAGIATAVNVDAAIEQTLTDCLNMSDDDFVAYIKWTVNMWVDNPGACVRIDDIGEI